MVLVPPLNYSEAMSTLAQPVGTLLRTWRKRRRLSQLNLALDAEVSTKHLSFLETGRALPSREMLLRLADQLEIPLRERNVLLVAGGYAPDFPERSLDDPALKATREAVRLVLAGHEPYPAVAVDRHWTLVASNRAASSLLTGIAPELLEPPVNVMRAALHPNGLAPRIANLSQWRAIQLARLRRQVEVTADPALARLLDEVNAYPIVRAEGESTSNVEDVAETPVAILQVRTEQGILSFLYTTTVFGTPMDVTIAELAIESLFPADAATSEALRLSFRAERSGVEESRSSGTKLKQ
jgi:transcriptional regulator with XRE-family HTH domain